MAPNRWNIINLRIFSAHSRHHALSASSHHIPIRISAEFMSTDQKQQSHQIQAPPPLSPTQKWHTLSRGTSQQAILSLASDNNNVTKFIAPVVGMDNLHTSSIASSAAKDPKDLPTPSSTPTTSRKTRRRSNLFIPSSKKAEEKLKNSELGSGRAIPIKQGYLYKRSSNSLNKEWKKKYVTLCDDGRLTYHSSLHDYMDDSHGKVIALQLVTVKIPGQKPRGSKSILTNSALTSSINLNWKTTNSGMSDGIASLSLAKERKVTEKVLLTAFDTLREPAGKSNSQTSGDEGIVMSNSNSQTFLCAENNQSKNDSQTSMSSSSVKKRHRRMKSSGVKNNEVDGKCSATTETIRIKTSCEFLFYLFIPQTLMRMNFISYRWRASSGISKRPVRRNVMNGSRSSNKRYSNRCRPISRRNRGHSPRTISLQCKR